MSKLNNLIRETLTQETKYWPWPTPNQYEIMDSLVTMIRYELRSKNVTYPRSLGDDYKDFEQFDYISILALADDFYADFVKNLEKGKSNNHAVIKWMNKNPQKDVEAYLRKSIRNFITDLQRKANPEQHSIAVHLEEALQSLLDQKRIQQITNHGKINNPSIFCFVTCVSNEPSLNSEIKIAFLKTNGWNDLKNKIYQENSRRAPQILEKAIIELSTHNISCFSYKSIVDVLFEQIRSRKEEIPFIDNIMIGDEKNDGYELITMTNMMEDENRENESISLSEISYLSTTDQIYQLQEHAIELIRAQKWEKLVIERCIEIFYEIAINDEGGPGVQRRIAKRLGMPPQTVNDYIQRLKGIQGLREEILRTFS